MIVSEHEEVQDYIRQQEERNEDAMDKMVEVLHEIDDIKEVFEEKFFYMDRKIKKMVERAGMNKKKLGDPNFQEFSFMRAKKCRACV